MPSSRPSKHGDDPKLRKTKKSKKKKKKSASSSGHRKSKKGKSGGNGGKSGGSSAKGIPVEGLTGAGVSGKYLSPAKTIQSHVTKTWRPEGRQDLNDSNIIHFHMKVPAGKLVRFGVDPFIMHLEARYLNDQFTNAADANPAKKHQHYFVRPKTVEPRVFFEGALGGASLIERVEVLVNGEEIRQEKMGSHGYLYGTLNRLLMSTEARVSKYGRDLPRVSLEEEHSVANDLPDVLKESMDPIHSEIATSAAPKILRFGMDGVWPFDSQSNLCAAITGQQTVNGYLPPDLDLTVRLHFRADRTALLQRAEQLDAAVYVNTAIAMTQYEKVQLDVKDIGIQYDELVTDPASMAEMKAKTEYYVDVPRVAVDQVESGKMFSHNTVNVPPGTQFLILAWVWEPHVFYKPAHNKPLSARFHFPPNAENVNVCFEGETTGLTFAHGFEELGTKKAARSLTSLEYYRKLIHQKWYSKSYHHFIPGDPKRSYDDCLVFDLTAHKQQENRKLNVHVKYDDKQAAAGYYLASVMVQQYLYTYRHEKEVSCQLVV